MILALSDFSENLFCSVGIGLSVSSAAHILFSGFSIAWLLLLEVRALWLFD